MPVIYLKHPRHGSKVATCEEEAVLDEENGWQRYDVAAVLKSDAELPKVEITGPQIEDAERDEYRKRWEEKFGKPPHHRKSLSTLRAEVEAA